MTRAGHRFSVLQRFLHWLMAACILAMLFIGVGMNSTIMPKYVPLLVTHKRLGVTVFILALIRLGVRLRYGVPLLPDDLPGPMKVVAYLSHYALYTLMIVMPLLGLTMQWTGAYPIVLYGDTRLPTLLPQSDVMHTLLWDAHFYLAYAFFAIILLHVAAALFHALIRQDGVFESMAPTPSHDAPPAVKATHAE